LLTLVGHSRCPNIDLGRTPDWLNNEFAQNNTLCSISYWRSIDELEAFARRPIHLKGLKFLASALLGPKGHDLGVIVSILFSFFTSLEWTFVD
jgi:hypothetical protein